MIKEKVAENTELLNRFTLYDIYHILSKDASGNEVWGVVGEDDAENASTPLMRAGTSY